jgi:hypothetical protein
MSQEAERKTISKPVQKHPHPQNYLDGSQGSLSLV